MSFLVGTMADPVAFARARRGAEPYDTDDHLAPDGGPSEVSGQDGHRYWGLGDFEAGRCGFDDLGKLSQWRSRSRRAEGTA